MLIQQSVDSLQQIHSISVPRGAHKQRNEEIRQL